MCKHIFLNGRLYTEGRAKIPINDRGFLYGDGLFETLRSYGGYVFMLEAHLQRLFSSLGSLGFNLHFDKDHLKQSLARTLAKNRLGKSDAYIKIIVTRGIYSGDLHFSPGQKPNLIIITSKLRHHPREDYLSGINIVSASIRRKALGNDLYTHKLINYFENIYARDQAHRHGGSEAIFLTKDRLVLEGATSNIVIIKRNTISTPPLNQNILPGITRAAVIDICRENRIRVRQKKIHYSDVINSHEVFLTNSVMEIMPVKKVDRHIIGRNGPGELTKKLMELYKNKLDSSSREEFI